MFLFLIDCNKGHACRSFRQPAIFLYRYLQKPARARDLQYIQLKEMLNNGLLSLVFSKYKQVALQKRGYTRGVYLIISNITFRLLHNHSCRSFK
ncbi:hypothetical protein DC498_06320 [Terrimonas sp.]|nr:hypothetical protein DC498_06320 [Terrimonas sp.]